MNFSKQTMKINRLVQLISIKSCDVQSNKCKCLNSHQQKNKQLPSNLAIVCTSALEKNLLVYFFKTKFNYECT